MMTYGLNKLKRGQHSKLVGKFYYLLLITLFIYPSFGFSQEEESILWTPGINLSWKDFKGKPDKLSGAAAVTASGISYSYSASVDGNQVKLDMQIDTFFYPNESWYKPEICNAHMLGHEQLHFDISALFAQKFRDRIKKKTFSKNVKSEVRKIYKSILKELEAFQDLYDSETDFSRNFQEQMLWQEKVYSELRKAYSNVTD